MFSKVTHFTLLTHFTPLYPKEKEDVSLRQTTDAEMVGKGEVERDSARQGQKEDTFEWLQIAFSE